MARKSRLRNLSPTCAPGSGNSTKVAGQRFSWPKEYGGRSATSDAASLSFWEELARVDAPAHGQRTGSRSDWTNHHRLWNRSAKRNATFRKILSAEEIWCQGLFRSRMRVSDLAGLQNGSTAGRRSLHRERSKGVDQLWHPGRLVRGSWSAPTPASPSHRGPQPFLLVEMKSPGVEVRPLRQMTGESEFSEVVSFSRCGAFRLRIFWAR